MNVSIMSGPVGIYGLKQSIHVVSRKKKIPLLSVKLLSRMPQIQMVEGDKSDVTGIIPSVWQVSDETVVRLETDAGNYFTVMIEGLKPGEVTIDYAGVRCEIKVMSI